MRGHGMTSGTRERFAARAPTYDVTMLGWNYRMDEFRAAVGLVQLKSLRRWNDRRGELSRLYRDALRERGAGATMPFANVRGPSAYHLLPVLLPGGADREELMGELRDAGVQTTVHYSPIHWLSFYRSRFPSVRLPQTEEFARRELTLPLHPKLTDSDVEIVADALVDILARQQRRRVAR
jgi:dTDP-4-amino-4,6-dideoxygalactose transaminase